jgi:Uma2 family endonuclease
MGSASAVRMAARAPKIEVMTSASSLRHVRPVRPLRFREQEPEEERLGQSRRHLHLCEALYELLRASVSFEENTIGADQFVYFDGSQPRRCLAPDGFVKLGQPDADFDSWMVWERGAPDVAFEVLSPSDTDETWTLEEKIDRYHELGVRELITFNVDAAPGGRLRAWDRLEGDFVERVVEGEKTPCLTLGLEVTVGPVVVDEGISYPACIRLARDADGRDLVPTREEERLHAEESRRRAEEERRHAEEERRRAEASAADANARVAELERELARLRKEG